MIALNVRNKFLLTSSSVIALASGLLYYFNIDTPDRSKIGSTRDNQLKPDKTEEEEFLPKGGDPLAQATDKFLFHSFKQNPQRAKEFAKVMGLKADGATPDELKKLEKFSPDLIEIAEGQFEARLVIYLKDGTKWSHWRSK